MSHRKEMKTEILRLLAKSLILVEEALESHAAEYSWDAVFEDGYAAGADYSTSLQDTAEMIADVMNSFPKFRKNQ